MSEKKKVPTPARADTKNANAAHHQAKDICGIIIPPEKGFSNTLLENKQKSGRAGANGG